MRKGRSNNSVFRRTTLGVGETGIWGELSCFRQRGEQPEDEKSRSPFHPKTKNQSSFWAQNISSLSCVSRETNYHYSLHTQSSCPSLILRICLRGCPSPCLPSPAFGVKHPEKRVTSAARENCPITVSKKNCSFSPDSDPARGRSLVPILEVLSGRTKNGQPQGKKYKHIRQVPTFGLSFGRRNAK